VSVTDTDPRTDEGDLEPVDSEQDERKPFWKELPVLIVIAFIAALLIKTFLLQAFYIPSASMEPTLQNGDRVLVEKVSYRFGGPERGDVVVFERDVQTVAPPEDGSFIEDITEGLRSLFGFPTQGTQDFIKRVMAVSGDTIEGRDGIVYVNGQAVEEPYLPDEVQTADFPSYQVPQGELFVMGDNRGNSDDSRSIGGIPEGDVVGRAFALIWPVGDMSGL